MAKILKVKISGTYRDHDKNKYDYAGVYGEIPFCDEDIAKMHVKDRFAIMWLKMDKRYKAPAANTVASVWFDDIEVGEGALSFANKEIRQLTFEELQDLATAYDLRRIPNKKTSIRDMQEKAYIAYSTIVLGKPINVKDPAYNFAKLPPLHVKEGVRRDNTKKVTNEEIIEAEMKSTSEPKTTLTMDELKTLAREKNIDISYNPSFDELYAQLYAA